MDFVARSLFIPNFMHTHQIQYFLSLSNQHPEDDFLKSNIVRHHSNIGEESSRDEVFESNSVTVQVFDLRMFFLLCFAIWSMNRCHVT